MSERTSPLTSLTYDEYKNNVSAEIIHGRFAMLGVTGAWAQENLVGTPWFMAGEECTFDSCSISYLNNKFEASYDGALLGIIFLEIVLMGGAEGYRTGLLENPFDDVTAGSVFPGGRFDPLNFSEGKAANFFGEDLDTLKIKELKHCRLAMLAWLGILAQSSPPTPRAPARAIRTRTANWSALRRRRRALKRRRPLRVRLLNESIDACHQTRETWRASDEGSEETSARARAARAARWRRRRW